MRTRPANTPAHPAMPLLFLTFLLVPLLEIYLLIEIGSLIGAAWTVAAVVGTAALGAALVRRQGLVALARFRAATEAGELPALTIMEGLVLLVAGALLLTPGFFDGPRGVHLPDAATAPDADQTLAGKQGDRPCRAPRKRG